LNPSEIQVGARVWAFAPSGGCWVQGVITAIRHDGVNRTLVHLRRADGNISTGFFPVILGEAIAGDLAREIAQVRTPPPKEQP
jgi:hypothetical protein